MFQGKDNEKRIEVLAPAGSFESLKAAVAAGADAVYGGGTRFGARAFAHNFTEAELLEAIDYVHLHGCRFYLTVNTLFKENELRELPGFLKPLYERGLDAVIVQDVGVLRVVRSHFPDLDIHASTQMTLTGAYGARFLKQAGAVRVVPARELSIEEVRRLKEQTEMEVECFVHGALCYCYSGQCLMSSMIGGRSGNRGQCAQPCRLFYQSGRKSGYLLSMKDICTLDLIPELVEAGIDSFKIEGRMKRPEYVAGVTSAYRKYTDFYLQYGKDGFYVEAEDKRRLLDLYNRGGFHGGYYTQRNGREMLSLKRPDHAGVAAVKVLSQKGRELKGLALTDLSAGDVLEFAPGKEPCKTARPKEVIASQNTVGRDAWKYTFGTSAKKGSTVDLLAPRNQKITVGSVLCRTRNQQLLDELEKTFVFGKKQEKVYGFLKLCVGKPATLEVACKEARIKVQTALNAETANSRPLEEAQIRKQMYKTKDTPFVFEKLDIVLEGALFLPLQQFNELRRNALEALEKEICGAYHRKAKELPQLLELPEDSAGKVSHGGKEKHVYRLSALVETREQLKVVLNSPLVERIYLDFDLFEHEWERIQSLYDESRETAARPKFQEKAPVRQGESGVPRLYVALPFVVRTQTAKRMESLYGRLLDERLSGVLIRNYESFQFLKEHEFPGEKLLDYSLYVMNRQSILFWKEQEVDLFTLPTELNARELATLGAENCELVVYGHYPVMVSAQCIQKTTDACTRAGGYLSLTDRRKFSFPVKLCCSDCYNVIYNTKPLCLYDLPEEIGDIAPKWIRFQFTVEGAARTAEVLGQYGRMANGNMKEAPAYEYTRGHFHRKGLQFSPRQRGLNCNGHHPHS